MAKSNKNEGLREQVLELNAVDDWLRAEVVGKVNWKSGGHGYNWRNFVGPYTRGIWHTLTDDQKFAIAKDAREFDSIAAESAWERDERN